MKKYTVQMAYDDGFADASKAPQNQVAKPSKGFPFSVGLFALVFLSVLIPFLVIYQPKTK